MSTWSVMSERITIYWQRIFGKGPVTDTCVLLSHLCLGILFTIALAPMVLWSLMIAMRRPTVREAMVQERTEYARSAAHAATRLGLARVERDP